MKKTQIIVSIIIAFTATAGMQAWGLNPALPPGDNFDLSHFYLGLPYDGPDDGPWSDSVSAASLVAGYEHTDYFYTDTDGSMVFWAPVTGATTEGSSYPRSELREQIVPGNNNINWLGYGTHTLTAQCKVTQLPSSEKVIIGQIHSKTGLARPLVKLLYDGSKNPNRIRVLIKEDADDPNNSSDVSYDFPDVPLNGTINYNIQMQDGVVTITVNGTTHVRDVFGLSSSWTDEEFYFKAGSYCQDNSGDSSEGARVAFYSLTRSHSVAGQSDLTVASPYGTPSPTVGTSSYADGTLINASMSGSPDVSGTTRQVVTGWTGTGDVVAGSGASTSFTLTQDSSVTWLWQTQYWLDTEVSVGGTVNVADGWFNSGVGVSITATPAPGYYFSNWTGASSSTIPVLNLTMNAAKSVTAVFVSIGPELTVTSPYGSPNPAVGIHTYAAGTLINASISGSPEISGTTRHLITGWTGTGNVVAGSGASTSFTLTQDSMITWQWQTQYWLDTAVSGNGSVDVADAWFDSGTNVTITATPAAGHIFVNWSGDSSSTNPVLNLTMDAAKAATANFVSAVDLTVASPYGIPIPAVGTATYGDNTLINASMSGSPVVSGTTRHVVTGWTGTGDVIAGSGASTSFTLTQDSSITWQWQTQYWLDTEVSGSGSVDVTDAWFDSGANITITATAELGHHFVNWSGDSSSTNPVLNLTMDAAKAVTANFEVNPPGPPLTQLNVVAVTASSYDTNNAAIPENTLDGNLGTRWSAQGDGQWIEYDLGTTQSIHEIKLAWYKGNERTSDYDVQVSLDGTNWITVAANQTSSGTTLDLEIVDIPNTSGRYVRIVGYGNSVNDWTSITEIEIWGLPELPTDVYIPMPEFVGGGVQFVVPSSVDGLSYQLEYTDALTPPSWEDMGPAVLGDGSDLILTDPGPVISNRFYRLLLFIGQ